MESKQQFETSPYKNSLSPDAVDQRGETVARNESGI